MRQLIERRIRLCTVPGIIVNETVLSYQYFSTVHESILKTWLGHGIFKIVFIFVDQESHQKWNPFLLEIGNQSGVGGRQKWNQNWFFCIRRVKATKMSKSWSNYSFLFLFLSRIRKGLSSGVQNSEYWQCNYQVCHTVQGIEVQQLTVASWVPSRPCKTGGFCLFWGISPKISLEFTPF